MDWEIDVESLELEEDSRGHRQRRLGSARRLPYEDDDDAEDEDDVDAEDEGDGEEAAASPGVPGRPERQGALAPRPPTAPQAPQAPAGPRSAAQTRAAARSRASSVARPSARAAVTTAWCPASRATSASAAGVTASAPTACWWWSGSASWPPRWRPEAAGHGGVHASRLYSPGARGRGGGRGVGHAGKAHLRPGLEAPGPCPDVRTSLPTLPTVSGGSHAIAGELSRKDFVLRSRQSLESG